MRFIQIAFGSEYLSAVVHRDGDLLVLSAKGSAKMFFGLLACGQRRSIVGAVSVAIAESHGEIARLGMQADVASQIEGGGGVRDEGAMLRELHGVVRILEQAGEFDEHMAQGGVELFLTHARANGALGESVEHGSIIEREEGAAMQFLDGFMYAFELRFEIIRRRFCVRGAQRPVFREAREECQRDAAGVEEGGDLQQGARPRVLQFPEVEREGGEDAAGVTLAEGILRIHFLKHLAADFVGFLAQPGQQVGGGAGGMVR